jgi:hypothetical protein
MPGGRFDNGATMISEHRVGAGTVTTLAMALDPSSGNLPSRKSFVPLVHELVYHLAGSGGQAALNVQPAALLKIRLGARAAGGDKGLRGSYYAGAAFEKWLLDRTDPAVDFQWGTGSPAPTVPPDNFSVRWTGSLLARETGKHEFFLSANDAAALWVDGASVLPRTGPGVAELEAGRAHEIVVEYIERGHLASIRLEWQPPGQPRQVVPPERLSPQRSMDTMAKLVSGVRLVTPSLAERPVDASAEGGALVLTARDAVEPGLYRLRAPSLLTSQFPDLVEATNTIPVAVSGAGEEGRLAALESDDFAWLRAHVDIVRPESVEQLLAVLRGGVAGRELWRALTLAAVLIAFAEILLSRWIGSRRRSGTAGRVDLGAEETPLRRGAGGRT